MYCNNCGIKVREQQHFCSECGAKYNIANHPDNETVSNPADPDQINPTPHPLPPKQERSADYSKNRSHRSAISRRISKDMMTDLPTISASDEDLTEAEKLKLSKLKMKRDENGNYKLGGWLLTLSAFVCIAVIHTIINISELSEIKKVLTSMEHTINNFEAFLFYFYLALPLLVAFQVYNAYLLFSKRRLFRAAFPTYLAMNLLSELLMVLWTMNSGLWEFLGSHDKSELMGILIRSLVGAVIWGLYISRSVRAKVTLIN